MAVIFTVAEQSADYAIGVSLSGLTVGRVYRVERETYVETKPVRQWTATSPSEDWLDVLVPFGVDIDYRLVDVTGNNVVVASAGPIQLPWAATPDVPMFDTNDGSWPVLRAANNLTLPAVRLPVADYSADFGFRSTTLPILGSYWPVVASQPMMAKRFTVVLLTPDSNTRADLMRLFRLGFTFHLRSPCVDGLGDVFFKVIDITESVPLKDRPLLRQWQIEAQQVARPVGYDVLEWAYGRKWADVETMGTWADVKAKGSWKAVKLPDPVTPWATRPQAGGGDW